MTSLKNTISTLVTTALSATITDAAEKIAEGVLESLRTASIEELFGNIENTAPPVKRSPGRPKKAVTVSAAPVKRGPGRPKGSTNAKPAAKAAPKAATERLARRTPEEIEADAKKVVAILKKGVPMGAEEIRKQLGMDKRSWPKVQAWLVDNKIVKTTGQKRATTYGLKGGGNAKANGSANHASA